jgi:hypothetical protein
MKLWLISQDVNNGYDTFDSLVVTAESEEEARLIHPSRKEWPKRPDAVWSDDWARYPHEVEVKYLGEAAPEFSSGEIICASFNAG